MIKVILVDDDVEIVEGLSNIINWEENGFALVAVAKNGYDALNLITKLMPDVLITDISMPIMDGLTLIKEAKKFKPDLQTVIISCHEEFDFAIQAMRLKADEYLIKHALSEDEIVKTLKKLAEKREEQKEGNKEIFSQTQIPAAVNTVKVTPSNINITTTHTEILKALDYIDNHLNESISCDGLATYVNMNSSYFSRLFKREIGVNFSDFIIDKRMQVATDMLSNTNSPIDEIVAAVGIESISYFYRMYKRITGCTPGDVRNKAQASR